jgi:hypothetical protein
MASSVESPRRYIRLKRKATQLVDPTSTFKKLKFVGSSNKGDDQTVKDLIVTKTPSLAVFDEDLMITDYEDFLFKQKDQTITDKIEGKEALNFCTEFYVTIHFSCSCQL